MSMTFAFSTLRFKSQLSPSPLTDSLESLRPAGEGASSFLSLAYHRSLMDHPCTLSLLKSIGFSLSPTSTIDKIYAICV